MSHDTPHIADRADNDPREDPEAGPDPRKVDTSGVRPLRDFGTFSKLPDL